jgi:hypothetical protein
MADPFVVFAVLDALPCDWLTPDGTPTLWSLAEGGGAAREGGRAVLCASTYPNHASFVTGVEPDVHRIFTSRALRDDGGTPPAQDVGPRAATLFDRCRSASRRALAAVGDQNLIGVCGGEAADRHWPPRGELPEGTPRARLGYAEDCAVADAIDALDPSDADLLFLQLDQVDTALHLDGVDSPEARAQGTATDAVLGRILEHARARWDETLVIVVSDHDQEAVTPGAVDLQAEVEQRGLPLRVLHDGTAALIIGDTAIDSLLELPAIVGASAVAKDCHVVWGEAGQQFGIDWGLKAQHGSPRTARQLAVVGGGHPRVTEIAARLHDSRPPATLWAGLIADFLGLGHEAGGPVV